MQFLTDVDCCVAAYAYAWSPSATQGAFGLRRIDSADIRETSNVVITALVLAARRNDAALEQIVGRLSLEPHISAAAWQVDQVI